jgi:hypothetical protein
LQFKGQDVTWCVLIRAAAERDLDEAQKWYDGQRPGLGAEFLVSIAEAFTRLEQDPERYVLLYNATAPNDRRASGIV